MDCLDGIYIQISSKANTFFVVFIKVFPIPITVSEYCKYVLELIDKVIVPNIEGRFRHNICEIIIDD